MGMRLFQTGTAEPLKAGVHVALGLCAGACCGYNLIAWLMRREPHLFSNTILYGLITVLEAGHVRQHAQQLEKRNAADLPLVRE